MAYIYDIADVWAASGTTFTGIKLNVTDTASAAGSLLMDLQVGGASRFSVNKAGRLLIGTDGTATDPALCFGVYSSSGFNQGSSRFDFVVGAIERGSIGTMSGVAGFRVAAAGAYTFASSTRSYNDHDLALFRDAANTLAQRNGVNAQAFNLYNTYTDASNYERGMMRWNANVLEIGTQVAGTGTLRAVALRGDIINIGKASQSAYDISLVPAASNTLHICQPGGGAPLQVISSSGIRQRATYQFAWSVGNDASVAPDTGVARNAAGVVKITDGSTGTGQLIFIVPTTNPGITGALWNNAGTLAIS